MTAKERAIVEPHALSAALKERLKNCKLLYITAPVGYGKTTAVRWHFRTRPHTYASLWDEDALDRAERDNTGLTILDDCHVLADRPDLQARLCALLRSTPAEGRVVLLSCAPLPEWLLPFQLSGLLSVLDSGVLALSTGDAAKLARELGLELSQEDLLRLHRESRGHPLMTRLICLELAEGHPLNTETVRRAYVRMFDYLDRELFACWDSKIRRLLLSVSFFDSFSIELSQVLTGDSQVEQTLRRLLQISSFLDRRGDAWAILYPPFRAYLRHKAETTWSRQQIDALYANAGMYFQLRGDLPAALDCYAKSGNHAKVSELLVEHSKQHPGHGVYYQLRSYYRSLPEREILSSPELMSGMSILCSLTFDVDGSEKWYAALKAYADGLDRRSPERKTAQGLVDYLNIALPHRGSVNIRDILLAAYDRLAQGGICLPEFCVTSNTPSILRGGKDFSSWVPKDKLLYATLGKPVEVLLGRLGVGLPDVALTESRYEKGEDISDAFLTLSSLRGEIQRRGAPEMEFVLTALLAICRYRMEAEDWQEHLAAALDLAKEYGYVRVFAHLGAALQPLLRTWAPQSTWAKKELAYLTRVQKAVNTFAALYPDHLAPAGSASIPSLTKKELEVLRLLCQGKGSGEIREILNITDNTLKTHSRKLFQKLNVNSRAEAAHAAQKLHLV